MKPTAWGTTRETYSKGASEAGGEGGKGRYKQAGPGPIREPWSKRNQTEAARKAIQAQRVETGAGDQETGYD